MYWFCVHSNLGFSASAASFLPHVASSAVRAVIILNIFPLHHRGFSILDSICSSGPAAPTRHRHPPEQARDTCDWWPPGRRGERWTDSFYQDWGPTRLKCTCTTPPPPCFWHPRRPLRQPPFTPPSLTSPDGWDSYFSLLISSSDLSSHPSTPGDTVQTGPIVRDFNQSLLNWLEVFFYLLQPEKRARQISEEASLHHLHKAVCEKKKKKKKKHEMCWDINHKSLCS